MQPLHPGLFEIYALSLPRGLGFGRRPPVSFWASDGGLACGCVRRDEDQASFGVLIMRRRIDDVWTVTSDEHGFESATAAEAALRLRMREGDPREPVPSGVRAHEALHDTTGRAPSEIFKFLARPTHHAAAWVLNQTYLALPRPDRNWVGDCQTGNFHTRLWEAMLVAALREQGVLVTQPYESPDFRIETRRGGVTWIEAVTANPTIAYDHVNAPISDAPSSPEEIYFGEAAVRFAKTIGNKLDRRYDQLSHVTGQPFALALADFQAGGSMVWSRQALVGYLYGMGAREVLVDGSRAAEPIHASQLHGASKFPAGLFTDDRHAELSGIVFSNACTLSKLNRIAMSRGAYPGRYRYTRVGEFFDRTPGATRGIPFCLDVTSEEYKRLWVYGHEPWAAELEVFHNPFARQPMAHELLPEATHWFLREGEYVCEAFHETSILRSRTLVRSIDDPPLTLDELMSKGSGADSEDAPDAP